MCIGLSLLENVKMSNLMYLENNCPLPNLSAIELWPGRLSSTRTGSITASYSVVISQDTLRGHFDSGSLFLWSYWTSTSSSVWPFVYCTWTFCYVKSQLFIKEKVWFLRLSETLAESHRLSHHWLERLHGCSLSYHSVLTVQWVASLVSGLWWSLRCLYGTQRQLRPLSTLY